MIWTITEERPQYIRYTKKEQTIHPDIGVPSKVILNHGQQNNVEIEVIMELQALGGLHNTQKSKGGSKL